MSSKSSSNAIEHLGESSPATHSPPLTHSSKKARTEGMNDVTENRDDTYYDSDEDATVSDDDQEVISMTNPADQVEPTGPTHISLATLHAATVIVESMDSLGSSAATPGVVTEEERKVAEFLVQLKEADEVAFLSKLPPTLAKSTEAKSKKKPAKSGGKVTNGTSSKRKRANPVADKGKEKAEEVVKTSKTVRKILPIPDRVLRAREKKDAVPANSAEKDPASKPAASTQPKTKTATKVVVKAPVVVTKKAPKSTKRVAADKASKRKGTKAVAKAHVKVANEVARPAKAPKAKKSKKADVPLASEATEVAKPSATAKKAKVPTKPLTKARTPTVKTSKATTSATAAKGKKAKTAAVAQTSEDIELEKATSPPKKAESSKRSTKGPKKSAQLEEIENAVPSATETPAIEKAVSKQKEAVTQITKATSSRYNTRLAERLAKEA
ncbi:hypothetical protein ONZ45_g6048 [Pleurotus djamor]|nr:hypothetical protein ONZ45_g6048 [Pleurotus djamor]